MIFVMEFYQHSPGDVGVMDTIAPFESVEDARAAMSKRLMELIEDPELASHQKPAMARLFSDEGFHFLSLGVTSKGIQELDRDDDQRA